MPEQGAGSDSGAGRRGKREDPMRETEKNCRMGRLVLIDNYDSFSYNLYQMLGALGAELTVFRNDEKTPGEIEAMQPDGIVLSPGPDGRRTQAAVWSL